MDDLSTPKPFACKASGCGLSFTNEDHLQVHEKKHEMILNLELEQKSANIFVADQTPTPTRLIKNCEEVGLFDDLRHVNPFDETFRRAVELKNNNPPLSTSQVQQNDLSSSSHDSLHTPQVFPVTEITESGIPCQQLPITPSIKVLSNPNTLSHVPSMPEHPKTTKTLPMILPKQVNKPQTTIQLIQPQVITLNFPTPVISTVPVQTVKPFILPKNSPEPSTANCTPSSALPIKERLKAILNSNSKRTLFENNPPTKPPPKKAIKPKQTFDDDCLVRRRAAAERYRNKIKKEHFDLRKKNSDLAAENAHLKATIKQLRLDLARHQNCCPAEKGSNSNLLNGGSEIQIPPSTVRLVMNIPKLVIQPTGQTVMQNPVTFAVEKL